MGGGNSKESRRYGASSSFQYTDPRPQRFDASCSGYSPSSSFAYSYYEPPPPPPPPPSSSNMKPLRRMDRRYSIIADDYTSLGQVC